MQKINKFTAEALGIDQDHDGCYYSSDLAYISVQDHNEVINKMQESELLKNIPANNLHLIKVTTVFSGIKAAKVKLESQRFPHNKAVLLSYSDFTENHNQDIAAKWLNDNGYPVVAIAEGKNCMFVLTNAFKPLVK